MESWDTHGGSVWSVERVDANLFCSLPRGCYCGCGPVGRLGLGFVCYNEKRIAVRVSGEVLYVFMQSHGERMAELSFPGESSESVIVDEFSQKKLDEA